MLSLTSATLVRVIVGITCICGLQVSSHDWMDEMHMFCCNFVQIMNIVNISYPNDLKVVVQSYLFNTALDIMTQIS